MHSSNRKKCRLVIAGLLYGGITTAVYAGSPSVTTKSRPDGGKSEIVTNIVGTECKIYNRSGQLQCLRTFAITNHSKAVQKCLKMKC